MGSASAAGAIGLARMASCAHLATLSANAVQFQDRSCRILCGCDFLRVAFAVVWWCFKDDRGVETRARSNTKK